MSRVIVYDHPLIKHKLTHLRDRNTRHPLFWRLINEITHLMLYEATRGLDTRPKHIATPLAPCDSEVLDTEMVLVPIMRAGLGMLEGCKDLIPTAKVGLIGLYRDEETLKPIEYYLKTPDMENAKVLVLDPMLATGGSIAAAISELKKKGAREINFMCIIASPEGIENLTSQHPDVDIFCAVKDTHLDENGYIIPGMGDCGDRLFGTK